MGLVVNGTVYRGRHGALESSGTCSRCRTGRTAGAAGAAAWRRSQPSRPSPASAGGDRATPSSPEDIAALGGRGARRRRDPQRTPAASSGGRSASRNGPGPGARDRLGRGRPPRHHLPGRHPRGRPKPSRMAGLELVDRAVGRRGLGTWSRHPGPPRAVPSRPSPRGRPTGTVAATRESGTPRRLARVGPRRTSMSSRPAPVVAISAAAPLLLSACLGSSPAPRRRPRRPPRRRADVGRAGSEPPRSRAP